MRKSLFRHRLWAVVILPMVILSCVALAACGSSSSGKSSNAAATSSTSASNASTSGSPTSSTPTGANATHGARRGRFVAIRECMQKNGISLQRPEGAPGVALGLPKGVTATRYEEVARKCGAGAGLLSRGARLRRAHNPAFKQGLTKFAACLRQNGVHVPAPNTSGNGPVFNTKGLNTKSAAFKSATAKCRAVLVSSFRRLPYNRPPTTGGPAPTIPTGPGSASEGTG